jgi:hypothetical protein
MRRRFSVLLLACFLGLPLAHSACTRNIDLPHALQIVDVTTGWFDAGIVEGGKNKLVPSVSFRLKNTGAYPVHGLQVNSVFRRVKETEEWGSAFVMPFGSEGLAPSATSQPLVLRSPLGYTGLQPRAQMLQNHEFVDATVQIFGKQGSAQWVKLGEFIIQRQLLTQ